VAVYASLLLPGSTVDTLIEEDGFIETAGTIGLATGSIAFARLGLYERRAGARRLLPWVLGLLAVGLFLAAGEEISWGQRIFGIATPGGIEAANTQGEINLHNLKGAQGTLDIAFQLFWLGLFVIVPVAAARLPALRGRLERILPVAPLSIAGVLVANYVVAQVAEHTLDDLSYTSTYPVVHSVTEAKEAVVGAAIGVAGLLALRYARAGERPPMTSRATSRRR
jgi:hypothetical protein